MSEFLEVVTRTFVGRNPLLLLRCHRSLQSLEDGSWTHKILVDGDRQGVARANRSLAGHEALGEWVWVLDDDDVCCHPHLISDLRWLSRTACPDAVIVRNWWVGADRVLPPQEIWGERPREGTIGTSCIITRGDVWNKYRDNWSERYAGDFDYIDGLFDAGLDIAWLNVVAAEIPQVNAGRAG